MDIQEIQLSRDLARVRTMSVIAGLTHWAWHIYYRMQFPQYVDFLWSRVFICFYTGLVAYVSFRPIVNHNLVRRLFTAGLWFYILNEFSLLAANRGETLIFFNVISMGLIVSTSVLRFKDFVPLAVGTTAMPLLIHLMVVPLPVAMVLHWTISCVVIFSIVGYLVRSHFVYREEVIGAHFKSVQSSKMAALGEMAAGMAHEINSPLAIIKGKADLLTRAFQSPTPFDHQRVLVDLDKISATAMRISKIINGLRSFSRNAESDPFAPVDLANVVQETLDLCSERLKRSEIELHVDVSAHLQVSGLATQLSQVLLNLISNSIDAIEKCSIKKIEIIGRSDGPHVILSVRDSGPPIPESIRERMMNPFFTTKDPGKGTGLGLSISKGILESHGGKLFLDPHQVQTCFVMKLPALTSAASSVEPAA